MQKNIDFGSFPDDPDADAIRTAFQKTQENFDELFAQVGSAAVTSINQVPGAGITVNQPTGNVVITANFSALNVLTSTLSIGAGANGGNFASINSSSQTLFIDLPSTLSNIANLSIDEDLSVGGNLTVNTRISSNTLAVTGNANVGNLNTNSVSANGNVSANNILISNSLTSLGTANLFDAAVSNTLTVNNISLTGDINAGNITGNVITANVFVGNITGNIAVSGTNNAILFNNNGAVGTSAELTFDPSTNTVSVLGNIGATNINGGNLVTANYLSGALTTAAQPNITSVGNLSSLTVTGNVTAGNLIGTLANGSTNISIAGNANVGVNFAGVPNVFVVSPAGVNVEGTLNVTSNVTAPFFIGDVIGNVSGNFVIPGPNTAIIFDEEGLANGSPNFTFDYTTNTLNLLGNANFSNTNAGNLLTANYVSGTLTTGSQPNITSLGTLTGLTVSGVSDFGDVSNVKISGGLSNYFLMTDTSGNLVWNNGTVIPVAGSNTQIQFNDDGNFAGNTGFTFNKTDGNLSVPGNVILGNLLTANHLSGSLVTNAQPNITSVGTLTSLIVQGNINSANLSGGNLVSANYLSGTLITAAQPNITSVGTLSSLSVTGNINTLGDINAGNIYGNIVGNITGNLVVPGSNTGIVFNDEGTANSSTAFTFNKTSNVVTLSGNLTTGNANLGNLATANYLAGVLTTAVQPNITTIGTLGSLSVSGNATVGNISGNGSGLSSITGANVTGQVSFAGTANSVAGANVTGTVANATYATSAGSATTATSATSATTAGTVTANAQPNITSLGTLTSLTVSGNVNIGNISGNGASLTSLNASNITSGTLDQARLANSSLTVNGTSITLGGSGTITANTTQTLTLGSYLTGTSFNGGTAVTANVDATTTNTANKVVARDANGSFSANIITASLSGSATSATTAGTVTTAAQPNITSVGTLTSLGVNNTVTAASFTANTGIFTGNGSGLTNLTGANVTGTVANATYATSAGSATTATSAISATTAGTVTTAAQPNITSVGTLTSLSVTGNITAANVTANLYSNLLTTGANTTAGTITGNWTLSTGSRMQATYADLAEYYEADQPYEPGTVLEFGGEKEVTIAEDESPRIAGVVTTNPAYIMNADCPGNAVAIALQGRVPVKVVGKIRKGDLMVSAGNGYARSMTNQIFGSVIGKSLQNFEGNEGVIEVAIGRL